MDHEIPPPDPDSDDERGPSDLVPMSGEEGLAELGRQHAAIAHWLEQSHRDATANRAQARELIDALDRAREGHEYMGRSLRDEKRRSRLLVLGLAFAPLLAVVVVWGIWNQMDAVRTDVGDRVDGVLREQERLRREQSDLARADLETVQRERVAGLDAEIDRLASQLDSTRAGLLAAQSEGSDRESGLRARLTELETAHGELLGLRAEVRTLRSRAGADAARNDAQEREIRELERALGDARARAATAQPTAPPIAMAPLPMPASPPIAPDADPPDAAPWAPATTTDAAPLVPDPHPAASRRPGDLERIRTELNRLLGATDEAVSYRVDRLGGVSGEDLLDVRVVGLDEAGQTIRALEAKRAEVTVQRDRGQVRLSFRDGHLELAGRQAPFFEGHYALELASDPEAWRISGLTCVRFE